MGILNRFLAKAYPHHLQFIIIHRHNRITNSHSMEMGLVKSDGTA